MLCAVGIPLGLLVGCLGIGVTLYCLRGSFLSAGESGGAVEIRFVLNLWALLAAAGDGLNWSNWRNKEKIVRAGSWTGAYSGVSLHP